MGWFTNMVFGKQEPEQNTMQYQDVSVEQEDTKRHLVDANGAKILPELVVEQVEPRCSSDMKHMELWLRYKNTSAAEIELMKMSVLNQSLDVRRVLRPGESHELRMYNGDTPTTDAYHTAMATYKITENGDYFEAEYMVTYQYEESSYGNYYLPKELRLLRPVRDRY